MYSQFMMHGQKNIKLVILLIKVDRIRHVFCIKSMKSIVKYFFLTDVLFLLGCLRLR